MTQKDLAVRINEKPSVIQEYESGKAIPHAQILSKMERVLGVKLRGKDIGNPVRCLLYTSPSPRDKRQSRMPSSA